MTGNRPPLAGVRIIAVEQYGAGPFGTMYLADLGAEIVKIEDPGSGGDVSRYIPPGQHGQDSEKHRFLLGAVWSVIKWRLERHPFAGTSGRG